jgi:hypothetical protein
MNRKMRAKANNAAAKAKRERRPCSKQEEVFFNETHCDECGQELQDLQEPVILVAVPVDRPKETLH